MHVYHPFSTLWLDVSLCEYIKETNIPPPKKTQKNKQNKNKKQTNKQTKNPHFFLCWHKYFTSKLDVWTNNESLHDSKHGWILDKWYLSKGTDILLFHQECLFFIPGLSKETGPTAWKLINVFMHVYCFLLINNYFYIYFFCFCFLCECCILMAWLVCFYSYLDKVIQVNKICVYVCLR